MSLYNQIFGVNPMAGLFIKSLGFDIRALPRLRDAWYWNGEIVIYTRTGGGNREDYAKEIAAMRAHPLFVRDEDDEYDNTYAMWYFKLPSVLEVMRADLDALPVMPRPAERWKKLLKGMNAKDSTDPDVARALEVGRSIFAQMGKKDDGEPGVKVIEV